MPDQTWRPAGSDPPLPLRAADNGDGTFSLMTAVGATRGPADRIIRLAGDPVIDFLAKSLGDGSFALGIASSGGGGGGAAFQTLLGDGSGLVAGSPFSYNQNVGGNITIVNQAPLPASTTGIRLEAIRSDTGHIQASVFVYDGNHAYLGQLSDVNPAVGASAVANNPYPTAAFVAVNIDNNQSHNASFNLLGLSSSAPVGPWDLALGSAKVVLTGNRQLPAPTNQKAGERYFLLVTQDAVGGRSLTFPVTYWFANGGLSPTLSGAPNVTDMLTFESDGVHMLCTGFQKNLVAALPQQPTSIPNLLAWWDASNLALADGAAVPTWADRSGNGWGMSGGAAPSFVANSLNGKGIVRFNGTTHYLTIPNLNGGSNLTLFFVVRTSQLDLYGLFETAPGQTNTLRAYPAGKVEWWNQDPSVVVSVPNAQAHILMFQTQLNPGRFLTFERDNLAQSNGSSGTTNPVMWTAAPAIGLSGGKNWPGDIAEVVLYNRALSASERAWVAHYLGDKWGVAVS